MNKQKIGLLGAFAGIAVNAIAGCCLSNNYRGVRSQTDFQRNSRRLSSVEHVQGHQLRRTTQEDNKYALEGIVVFGQPYYVQENVSQREGELPFYLISKNNHVRTIDRDDGEVGLDSEDLYIPTRIFVDSTDGKVLARSFPLATQGKYALSAKMTKLPVEGVDAGVFRETQEDARLNVKTLRIGCGFKGEEFYTPLVEPQELGRLDTALQRGETPDSLPFYLVPNKGTSISIEDSGRMKLRSPNGGFRPVRISRALYVLRRLEGARPLDHVSNSVQVDTEPKP